MKTKFNYFPNHGDEEGRNGFTIYYSDHEDEDDPEEYLVGAEYTEEEAIEVCARLNGILVAYSAQQNKELEEKLMSEQIENGYLQGFRVSNESEIQRLTKEVERLKLRCDRAVQFAGSMGGENTRLWEEVEKLKNDLLDELSR